MDEHTSHELAYKKGYEKGFAAGKSAAVKSGHWERTDDPEFTMGDFECSECEYLECDVDTSCFEPGVNCLYFCPNCGADMRKPLKGE